MSAPELLAEVQRKGVRLWAQDGQLRYEAPKGALTRQDIENLRASRAQLVSILSAANEAGVAGTRAPLSFSQLAHCNLYHLFERPAIRQIASATRLSGHLHVEYLREALKSAVRRHDALRVRIAVVDGVPMQEVLDSIDIEIEPVSLTGLSEAHREDEIRRLIDEIIMAPIDIRTAPLFGVRLLELSAIEHVLVVVMEHLISDAFSMDILLREMFEDYTQRCAGCSPLLPSPRVQFPQYALEQQKRHEAWLTEHGTYWAQHLADVGRVCFPSDLEADGLARGWGTLCIRIDASLKAELRAWCRQSRTTLAMGVFSAYAALVLRWCNSSRLVVQYVTNGRDSSVLQNTIGYLASTLCLLIHPTAEDRLVDLTRHVVDEYCKAQSHADFAFLESQVPRPSFVQSSIFNWIPQHDDPGASQTGAPPNQLTCAPVAFLHPMLRSLQRDSEPMTILYDVCTDTQDYIEGAIHFPAQRMSADLMRKFERNFLLLLRVLVRRPETRLSDIELCD